MDGYPTVLGFCASILGICPAVLRFHPWILEFCLSVHGDQPLVLRFYPSVPGLSRSVLTLHTSNLPCFVALFYFTLKSPRWKPFG